MSMWTFDALKCKYRPETGGAGASCVLWLSMEQWLACGLSMGLLQQSHVGTIHYEPVQLMDCDQESNPVRGGGGESGYSAPYTANSARFQKQCHGQVATSSAVSHL